MKLSEAILLGSMLRPQVIGTLFSNRGSCALGAAMEAQGLADGHMKTPPDFPASARREQPDDWRILNDPGACPACGGLQSIALIIIELNDAHHWSRAQIAEWVAEIEAGHDPGPRELADSACWLGPRISL